MLFLNQYVTGDFGDGPWLRHVTCKAVWMDWVGNLWMHLCSDHCLVMLIKRKSESESFSVTFNLSLNLEVVKFICFHSFVTMTEWKPTTRSLLRGTFSRRWRMRASVLPATRCCSAREATLSSLRFVHQPHTVLHWQEMHISLFFLEKKEWNLKCFHSFREWKVKWKCLEIEIESEKWNENAPRSRSRSEIGKKFSRILEKRDSRRVLTPYEARGL